MACYPQVMVVVVPVHDMQVHRRACLESEAAGARQVEVPRGGAMAGPAVELGGTELPRPPLVLQPVRGECSGIYQGLSRPTVTVLGLLAASRHLEFRRQAHQPGHPWLPGLRVGRQAYRRAYWRR